MQKACYRRHLRHHEVADRVGADVHLIEVIRDDSSTLFVHSEDSRLAAYLTSPIVLRQAQSQQSEVTLLLDFRETVPVRSLSASAYCPIPKSSELQHQHPFRLVRGQLGQCSQAHPS